MHTPCYKTIALDLFAGSSSSKRCRRRRQTCGHSGERRRGREGLREQQETDITVCKIDSQWGSCTDTPEWGMERGHGREGTCIYLWLVCVDVWQKPTRVKQLSSKKVNNYAPRRKKPLDSRMCIPMELLLKGHL